MTASPEPAAVLNGSMVQRIGSHRVRRRSWAEWLLDPAHGALVFGVALLLVYAAVPSVVYLVFLPSEVFLLLAQISVVAVVAMWAGALLPLFDSRFHPDRSRLVIGRSAFVGLTWGIFAVFLIVTIATAPSLPLLSALSGASPDVLSEERGAFLKGRTGPGLALLYVSTILVNTVVPYSIVMLYASRSKFRHLSALVFFAFCISFLQKALFLNLVLPLLAYFGMARKMRGSKAAVAVAGSALLLVAATFLSHRVEDSVAGGGDSAAATYFSAGHVPGAPLAYLVWRSVAVPVFTATDTLIVHAEQFRGEALLGATSSFVSAVFGMDRVNLERYVFEYQFGSWNEIANANAVFFVDAYVNFAWLGVVGFGLVVGQIFRWFWLSSDVAFRALWPLFAFVLFSASLIGMLLSNGFAYMLFHALMLRIRGNRPPVRGSVEDQASCGLAGRRQHGESL